MSVNKYNPTTGELTSLAGGTRTWIGTQAAYEAQKTAGTLPTDVLIIITDDEQQTDAEQISYNNTSSGLTADNVQDAIDEVNGKILLTTGTTDWQDSNHTSVMATSSYPTGCNSSNCLLLNAMMIFRGNLSTGITEGYLYQNANNINASRCQNTNGAYIITVSTRTDFLNLPVVFIWLKYK